MSLRIAAQTGLKNAPVYHRFRKKFANRKWKLPP